MARPAPAGSLQRPHLPQLDVLGRVAAGRVARGDRVARPGGLLRVRAARPGLLGGGHRPAHRLPVRRRSRLGRVVRDERHVGPRTDRRRGGHVPVDGGPARWGQVLEQRLAHQAVPEREPSAPLLQQPGLDGPVEQLVRLRLDNPDPDSKVIVLTTFDEDEYVAAALRAGAERGRPGSTRSPPGRRTC
ncbi:hypothetical protein [Nonomuraea sp. NPDC049709]|uniref:hypothetical protein n=1 Tax=Nonomuraea sp. NPDC049709 TaxID=3154736 RepID=UPI003419207A